MRVPRVHVVIDSGLAVDPDGVRVQSDGSVAWAMGAALGPGVTFKNDTSEQSNFHDYPVLAMAAAPQTSTVILKGDDRPNGVGEICSSLTRS